MTLMLYPLRTNCNAVIYSCFIIHLLTYFKYVYFKYIMFKLPLFFHYLLFVLLNMSLPIILELNSFSISIYILFIYFVVESLLFFSSIRFYIYIHIYNRIKEKNSNVSTTIYIHYHHIV